MMRTTWAVFSCLRLVLPVCVGACVLALTPALAQPPSFDCSLATHADEIAICADPGLSALESTYARGFAYVRETVGQKQAMSIAKSTLRKRRACGDDPQCLETVLQEAIATFQDMGAPVDQAAAPPSGASLPEKLGGCVRSVITGIGGRLDGDENFESGTAVIFANGGYQVSYEREEAIIASSIGDAVEICLIRFPKNCPPGDERGRWYRTTNLRTGEEWSLPDAQHQCGGA